MSAQGDSVLVKACTFSRFMVVGTDDPLFIDTPEGYIALEDSLPAPYIGDFFTFVFFEPYAVDHRPMVLYTFDGNEYDPSFYLPPNSATPCTSIDSTAFSLSVPCAPEGVTFQADFQDWSGNADDRWTFGLLQYWDEATQLFLSTDLLYTDIMGDLVANVPPELNTEGAIFRFAWSDIAPNGVQNNFLSLPDTIVGTAVLMDSLTACASNSGEAVYDLTEAFDQQTVNSFHTDSMDAVMGQDPIPDPSAYEGFTGEVVYAQMTQGPDDCIVVGSISLMTLDPPTLLSALPAVICEGIDIDLDISGPAPWQLQVGGEEWTVGPDGLWEVGPVSDPLFDTLLHITDANGCRSDDIDVSLTPLPELSLASSGICEGSILALEFSGISPWTLESSEDQLFADPYTASQQDVTIEEIGAATEILIWNVADLYCTDEDTLTIEIFPAPDYDTQEQSYCGSDEGAVLDLDEVTGAISLNGNDVKILDGDMMPVGQELIVYSDTTLTISVTSSNCTVYDSVDISLATPNVVDLGTDLAFCINEDQAVDGFEVSTYDMASIEMFDSDGQPFTDYQFYPDSILSFDLPPGATDEEQIFNFVITIAPDPPCPSAQDELTITLYPLPSVEVPAAICAGEEVVITDLEGISFVDYSLDGMDYSPAVITSGNASIPLGDGAAGTLGLFLTLTSDQECISTDTTQILILELPVADLLGYGSEVTLCLGQEEAELELDDTADGYLWDFPPIIEDNVSGTLDDISVTIDQVPEGVSGIPFFVTLLEETIVDGQSFSCSSTTPFTLSAVDSTCTFSEIYSLPGGIYIGLIENEGADASYHWLIDGQQTATGPIIVLDDTPTSISVTGSHYTDGRCSCSGEYALTGAAQIGRLTLGAFPNPVENDRVTLVLPAYFHDEAAEVIVNDMTGAVVYRAHLSSADPVVELMLPVGLGGIYGIGIRSERHSAYTRLIIR